jgi:hypothetical protein
MTDEYPDSDWLVPEIFESREEAEALRDDLNETPPELAYTPWAVGGPPQGPWRVYRSRGVIAEDLEREGQLTVAEFEEGFREAVAGEIPDDGYPPNYEGIRIEEVRLEGQYPNTEVVRIFRRFSTKPRAPNPGDPDCYFAYGHKIWPAEDTHLGEATRLLSMYFDEAENEFFDRVYRRKTPCERGELIWLTEPPAS